MTDFERLMQELEELSNEAWQLPLSNGKVVLDREVLSRISQGLQTHYPTELSRAQNLLDEREKILLKARTDAESLISAARQKSEQILNEQDIVAQAKKYADDIRANAEAEAARIKKGAVDFADAVLKQAEDHYDKNLSIIRHARQLVKKD